MKLLIGLCLYLFTVCFSVRGNNCGLNTNIIRQLQNKTYETWEGIYSFSGISVLNIDKLKKLYVTVYKCEKYKGELINFATIDENGKISFLQEPNENIKGVTPYLKEINVFPMEDVAEIIVSWHHPGNGGYRTVQKYLYNSINIKLVEKSDLLCQGRKMVWKKKKLDGKSLENQNDANPKRDVSLSTIAKPTKTNKFLQPKKYFFSDRSGNVVMFDSKDNSIKQTLFTNQCVHGLYYFKNDNKLVVYCRHLIERKPKFHLMDLETFSFITKCISEFKDVKTLDSIAKSKNGKYMVLGFSLLNHDDTQLASLKKLRQNSKYYLWSIANNLIKPCSAEFYKDNSNNILDENVIYLEPLTNNPMKCKLDKLKSQKKLKSSEINEQSTVKFLSDYAIIKNSKDLELIDLKSGESFILIKDMEKDLSQFLEVE